MSVTVTSPGVYDMTDAEYHADPVPGGSLSSTGARKLLDSPARFKWDRDHAQHSTAFDIGHAAHTLVLGVGAEFAVIDADDWRSKAAQKQRADAYEAGRTPLLKGEHEQVQAMAAAIRAHPVASAIFNPKNGKPEQSLFWTDEQTGMWLRARIDWTMPNPGGRPILVDYKTTTCASPSAIPRAVATYGYHQQADQYATGYQALGLGVDPAFLFVFQEKSAPYLVNVVELDADALLAGRAMTRKAIDVYAQCIESSVWPGYSEEINPVSLPPWELRKYEESL